MKTVTMSKDFTYRASRNVNIQFKAGETYSRVTEAAAEAIAAAGAGEISEAGAADSEEGSNERSERSTSGRNRSGAQKSRRSS